eukprot:TRINITY_DN1757_c0_g2_i4.p2 TRINITY_DN1757_c0_g2~~TRINITY_DN1757_c0_g2_i4.p2  ORF type:complete len:223 (+),score=49.41 TRINITY_DN1757_c0_g2_i4:111-779(+)
MKQIKVLEGSPVMEGEEKLMGKWAGLQLCFGRNLAGNGTLFVTVQRFVWVKEGAQVGFECRWEDTMMHAVCSDVQEYRAPHIFCMLDRELREEAGKPGEETHLNTNDIRIVPVTSECHDLLDQLFAEFSKAASLTPDDAKRFTGEIVKEGDFNPKKRKLDDTQNTPDPFQQISLVDGNPQEFFFGIPGEALTEEEQAQKLAEWDSKLIIHEEEEEDEENGEE